MTAYVSFLLVLAVWAAIALREEPVLRPYAVIYGVNAAVGIGVEAVFAILLDTYTFGGYTGFFLVTLGIEPLLGVLYAHYCGRWPVYRAVVAALLLAGPVEQLFLASGEYQYDRGWHPLLTFAFFTGYFLWTWWLTTLVHRSTLAEP